MNKIPYKVRVGISVGLFLWSIACIIATIVFSQQGLGLWVVIVGPILAVMAFVLSIILMPKSEQNSEHVTAKPKPRTHRPRPEKRKRSFISEKEWEELEEEDEECLYLMDDEDDK